MSLPSPWRADFPAFSAFAAEGLTYLDSAATAQKPQAVLDALNGYYLGGAANVHRAQHVPGERATRAFEAARSRVAHWLHAGNPAEVLFTRGTTEAINLVAYGLERHFRPGDELLVSALEHHANLLPWQQLALRRGLVLRVLPLDERGVIDLEQARHIIGERTRLLAISQLSNVLGTWQPVVELIQLARERGAWTLVDGAQGSVHGRHDLPGLGCDFYAFSGHKLYGPDGIGVLWGRPQALEQLAHWQFGGEMVRHTGFHEASFHAAPLGFEAGTPAVSAAICLGATIDWLATLRRRQPARRTAGGAGQLLRRRRARRRSRPPARRTGHRGARRPPLRDAAAATPRGTRRPACLAGLVQRCRRPGALLPGPRPLTGVAAMNPVLPEQAQEALDAFGHTASWEQRARLLLQWGERLAPLAEHERQEEHRVHGCESLVWLLGEQRDGHWRFRADSDARLIRGLLAVLLARVDGIETRELARLDLNDWFTCLGLSRQLSPSRSNGLNAVLQRMRELAGQTAG